LELRSLLPYPNSYLGASPHQQEILSFGGIYVSKDRLYLGRPHADLSAHDQRQSLSRRMVLKLMVGDVSRRSTGGVSSMLKMPTRARGQIAVSTRARCLGGVHGAAFVRPMFLAEYSTVIECFSPE
jgi:hypothetical protein